MTVKQKTAAALILFVFAGLGLFYYYKNKETANNNGNTNWTYCTQDVKQCSGGSYVGRTGPNCEFAACPVVPAIEKPAPTSTAAAATSTTIKIKFEKTGTVFGISINPFQILEDSRCPIDVQCVWAGRVAIKAKVSGGAESGEFSFETNQSVMVGKETIVLKDALPPPKAGIQIPPKDYEFVFEISKITSQ